MRGQVRRSRACCSRRAAIDDFVKFQRDDMAQVAEDHHRRQHPCRVRSSRAARSRAARRRHRQQFGHRPGDRAARCSRWAGRCTDSTVAPPTLARRALPRRCASTSRDGDAVDRAARALRRASMRSSTPPACCASATLGPLDHRGGRGDVAPACRGGHAPRQRRWCRRWPQRGRGRVVLIGSRVAQGMAGRSQYAATKAALVALARSWAAEVVARGVTVNVVVARRDGRPRCSTIPRAPRARRACRRSAA